MNATQLGAQFARAKGTSGKVILRVSRVCFLFSFRLRARWGAQHLAISFNYFPPICGFPDDDADADDDDDSVFTPRWFRVLRALFSLHTRLFRIIYRTQREFPLRVRISREFISTRAWRRLGRV